MKYPIALFAIVTLALSGCETVNGGFYYQDADSGAKGGMTFKETGPGWFIKIPHKDEHGEGVLEVEGTIPVNPQK